MRIYSYTDKIVACLITLSVIFAMPPVGIYATEDNSDTAAEELIIEEELSSSYAPEESYLPGNGESSSDLSSTEDTAKTELEEASFFFSAVFAFDVFFRSS